MPLELPGLDPVAWDRNYGEEDDVNVFESTELPEWTTVAQGSPAASSTEWLICGAGALACTLLRGVFQGKLTPVATFQLAAPLSTSATPASEPVDAAAARIQDPSLAASATSSLAAGGTFAHEAFEVTDAPQIRVLLLPSDSVPPELAFGWSNAVFEHLRPARVVVLGLLPAGTYVAREAGAEAPLLRQLATPHATSEFPAGQETCPVLEVPNLCDSMAAGLFECAMAKQTPCWLFLSLKSLHTSQDTLAAWAPALDFVEAAASVAVWPSALKALRSKLQKQSSDQLEEQAAQWELARAFNAWIRSSGLHERSEGIFL